MEANLAKNPAHSVADIFSGFYDKRNSVALVIENLQHPLAIITPPPPPPPPAPPPHSLSEISVLQRRKIAFNRDLSLISLLSWMYHANKKQGPAGQ